MAAFVRFGACVVSLACLLPAAGMAQRNGDVRNGFDNQPTLGEVQSREKAAGVALPQQEQRARTGTVDNIYRDLMTKERQDGKTDAPANPNAAGPLPR